MNPAIVAVVRNSRTVAGGALSGEGRYLRFMGKGGRIFNLGLACVTATIMILVNATGLLYLSDMGAGLLGFILCVSSFHLGGLVKGREMFKEGEGGSVPRRKCGGVEGLLGKIIPVVAVMAALSSTLRAENDVRDNSSRDGFIRDVVVALLETRASHINAEQHVEEAFRAWVKYQELAEGRGR